MSGAISPAEAVLWSATLMSILRMHERGHEGSHRWMVRKGELVVAGEPRVMLAKGGALFDVALREAYRLTRSPDPAGKRADADQPEQRGQQIVGDRWWVRGLLRLLPFVIGSEH